MSITVDTDLLYDRLCDETVALECPDIQTAQEIVDALLDDYDDPFETTLTPLTNDDEGTVDGYRLSIKKPWYSYDHGWFTTDPAQETEPYSEFIAA